MAIHVDLPLEAEDDVFAGDTIPLIFELTEGENPLDLTGYDITATFKRNADDADNDFGTIQKTIGSGIEVLDATNGEFVITLEPADTTNNEDDITYVFDVQLHLAGEVLTLVIGTLTVKADITQRAT